MVFEAILENLDLKTKVYKELKTLCPPETYFFTNTSSIPIKELDTRAELGGKIIGFHFYNPPAVQRLVELIIPERIDPELPELSKTLARRLGKIVIPSNDVAGFIGNGHFMRDGLHGISEAQRLSEEMGWVPAIYLVNRVSQQFLIRPMGIFQLIDYVGIDVFQSILNIMNPYFPDENLHSTLIDKMVSLGVKGGQYPDGSQKDGFLKYESGKIVGIFNPDSGEYQMLNDGTWKAETDEKIGPLPEGHQSWKDLLKNPERESVLKAYFDNLKMMDTLGARVAKQYLHRSKEIGLQLLNSGVANTAEDVNGVLMNGFYHLYGPINDFI
ncbi:MAG: 3-hydroxyacyl-CoA dehydrogenase family protein [Methanobacteriota archaeon]|nr:MAG: 3-hydroxyacyl-CoA dehydrogenase family protein [Euryarchaeota archaeon]